MLITWLRVWILTRSSSDQLSFPLEIRLQTILIDAQLKSKMTNALEHFKQNGPTHQQATATFWLLYFQMVSIMKYFIDAERYGVTNHITIKQNNLPTASHQAPSDNTYNEYCTYVHHCVCRFTKRVRPALSAATQPTAQTNTPTLPAPDQCQRSQRQNIELFGQTALTKLQYLDKPACINYIRPEIDVT